MKRRHRNKRRRRERRLEVPFSERPGAVPAVMSATWILGMAVWFMLLGASNAMVDTTQAVTGACHYVHEHLHERPVWR